jgi:hypothetical protein
MLTRLVEPLLLVSLLEELEEGGAEWRAGGGQIRKKKV